MDRLCWAALLSLLGFRPWKGPKHIIRKVIRRAEVLPSVPVWCNTGAASLVLVALALHMNAHELMARS